MGGGRLSASNRNQKLSWVRLLVVSLKSSAWVEWQNFKAGHDRLLPHFSFRVTSFVTTKMGEGIQAYEQINSTKTEPKDTTILVIEPNMWHDPTSVHQPQTIRSKISFLRIHVNITLPSPLPKNGRIAGTSLTKFSVHCSPLPISQVCSIQQHALA